MQDFFSDDMILGMRSGGMLHRFAVNGKQSGSLAAIEEIKDSATVMYGPRGCGFHFRNTVRVYTGPVDNLECVNLEDRDVIFGGEDKLRAVVKELDQRLQPDCIFILPTVVSDIINDDLTAVMQALQPVVKAKIVVIKSEAFSHMDKENSRKLLREKACQSCRNKYSSSAVFPGCGYVEVLDALVEQVMEPQDPEPCTVNIESFLWGYGAEEKLLRMKKLLNKMGIKVNAFLPSADLEHIKKAPRAGLNIVRRKKWALAMQERFGTDYIHLLSLQQWHGTAGIRDFYEAIGQRLGCLPAVQKVLQEEEEKIFLPLNTLRKEFAAHRFGLIVNALSAVPEYIRIYHQDFQLPLQHIILILNPDFQRDFSLSDEVMQRLYERIKEAKQTYGCEAEVTIDPSPALLQKVLGDCDYLIAGNHPRYACYGKPVLPLYIDRDVLDYESFLDIVREYGDRIRQSTADKHLLMNLLDYDPVFYPLFADDLNTYAAKEVYARVWRLRRK